MNAGKFMEALGMLDDRYIEEAAQYRRAQRPRWTLWAGGAAAACLLLAVWAGISQFWRPQPPAELPLLPVETEMSGAMGYEGYIAYDISELVSANPWREDMALTTLPVYKNALAYDEQDRAAGQDFEKMQALLLDVAARFGLDPDTLAVTDNAPDEETRRAVTEKFESVGDTVPDGYFDPTALCAEGNGLKIEVDQTLTARIEFDPPAALPDGYTYSYTATYEQIKAVADYLKTTYAAVLGERTQADICGGDYNIYAEHGYNIAFFDGSGDDVQQIVNYHFNRTSFYCNDDGQLFLARVYAPDLSQKAGDYPIITVQQAQQLLEQGHYITTVPYEMPGAEYVRKAELTYRTSAHEQYFMPYYRFYVELPEEQREHGLNDYGAYYVPAIDSAYLTEMPVWDGSFNR